MDEIWRRDAKWKKSDTKGQIVYDSTNMKYLNSQIQRQKVQWWFPAAGSKREEWVIV